ncbi:hypothetical protein [Streptomonospora litoralis]|uniref:Uncharacterized protein n=1 Tax=Streptomonospora litoralis TaxID=2498135 RepID=A0A4P6QA28_9ACTN|nr:hypothetical protein [Streptomonospora litoralis]QBI56319.1 hypothetical protein EKD16_22830 [Streptomonospora litoralis]
MENPLKRKNESQTDAGADGAQPMPGGSGPGEQGRHRTEETAASGQAVTGQMSPGQSGTAARPAGPPSGESAGAAPSAAQQPGTAAASDGSQAETAPGSASAPGGTESTGTVPAQGGRSGQSAPNGQHAQTDGTGKSDAPAQSGGTARASRASGGADTADQGVTLFSDEDQRRFQEKWRDAQGDFVDDPRSAVGTADELVDEVLRTLNEKFAAHKRTLEEQWSEQGEADTEALRKAMRGYRTFFRQLLQTND